jgi:hypothetical protein
MQDTQQDMQNSAAASHRGIVRSPQDFMSGLFLIAVAAFALYAASDLSAGTLRSMGPGMLPRAVAALIGVCGFGIIISALIVDGPRLESWSLRGLFFVISGVLAFAVTIRATQLDVFWSRIVLVAGIGALVFWLGMRMLPAKLPAERNIVAACAGLVTAIISFMLMRHVLEFSPQLKAPVGGLLVAGPLVVLISGLADREIRWKELVIFAVVMTALCIGLFRYALKLPIPVLILPNGNQI